MSANEQLWKVERASRIRLVKKAVFAIAVLLIFLMALRFWLTQPLFQMPDLKIDTTRTSPSRLEAHVTKLSQDLHPRNYLNTQHLNSAADYIRDEFQKTGGVVSEQSFNVNGVSYRNVILQLGDGNDRIVVGAHYDAAYDTFGADDNASGVAGLIELAHLLSKEQHIRPIEMVAYALEEPPFFGTADMGSYIHAKSLFDSGVQVRLMVCLEMIGYYSDEANTQKFPLILGRLLYPTRGNFTALVGSFTNVSTVRSLKSSMLAVDGINVYSLNVPAGVGGVDLSDHRNYWHFGYDAVMVTDTAFYRNEAYHTKGDTADRLDYTKMAKLIDSLNLAIIDSSNS